MIIPEENYINVIYFGYSILKKLAIINVKLAGW